VSTLSDPRAPAVVSLGDLLAQVTDRQPLVGAGKSGALLERVTYDGAPHVLKLLDPSRDWTMRAAGVDGGVPLALWRRGLLARMPACIEQPIVAVGTGPLDDGQATTSNVTALLMRDVHDWLFPVDDAAISEGDHLRVLDHLGALHAQFWQAGSEIDIVSASTRYLELSPSMARSELALGSEHLVPRLVAQGWPLLGEVAPLAASIVLPLAGDPGPLVAAQEATPQTLLHGNFKLDNLGVTPAGRTVVLDWETSGRGAATADLAWYLAINCRRLPQTKEASIGAYREALHRHGIDTEPWWERQLALSLLGGLVHFGWEKAFGGYDDELAWWEAQAVVGARYIT
jgi:hypothetical protein